MIYSRDIICKSDLSFQENSQVEEGKVENSGSEISTAGGGSQSHLGVAGLRPVPSPAGSTGSRSDTPASNSGKHYLSIFSVSVYLCSLFLFHSLNLLLCFSTSASYSLGYILICWLFLLLLHFPRDFWNG